MGNNATDTEDAIFRIAPAPGPAASSTPDNAINILLLSPGDPRHILKTIAQRYRHSSRPLHVSPWLAAPLSRAGKPSQHA